VVTGFHKTIEKGGYESLHGGATLGVMGVLIEKRACLGVIQRDLACHALTPAKIARAHQPYIFPKHIGSVPSRESSCLRRRQRLA